MDNNHPRVANNSPINARIELPPHRSCIVLNTWVIGLSHQNLLSAVAEMIDQDYIPVSGNWFIDHINELMYRGIITDNIPYAQHANQSPKNREQWVYTLATGFELPSKIA